MQDLKNSLLEQNKIEYVISKLQEKALAKNVYIPIHKDELILVHALLGNIIVIKSPSIFLGFTLGEKSTLLLYSRIHKPVSISQLKALSEVKLNYVSTVTKNDLEQWLKN